MAALRLVAVSGSARQGSLNGKLLGAAVAAATALGAQVETLDLRALDLPLYDGDLEKAQGVPDGARRLRDALRAADGLLVASPEYNGFPPPLLINALDWLSRLQPEGEAPAGLAVTAGKPLGLLAASPGALGGLRAMTTLRQFLGMTFALMPVPRQFALSKAHEAFADDGTLKDAKAQAGVDGVVAELLKVAAALKA